MRGEPTATTDPFLNAGLVGEWVRRDVAEKSVLLGTPLDRLFVEDGRIDTAVEFVQIHGVDAILEAAILGMKAGDGFVAERSFVDLAQLRDNIGLVIQSVLHAGKNRIAPFDNQGEFAGNADASGQ